MNMIDLTLTFILSQIVMFIAMGFDFLSFQFKKRQYLFLCLIVSASLISTHYFLLNKIAAGVIVLISVFRFITCYFTSNKKFMFLFIGLNTISLFFTYSEIFDLIFYFGLIFIIVGNFQKDTKLLRKIMMVGTSIILLYNIIIFTPLGILGEILFLTSNFLGYYRHHIKNKKNKQLLRI